MNDVIINDVMINDVMINDVIINVLLFDQQRCLEIPSLKSCQKSVLSGRENSNREGYS